MKHFQCRCECPVYFDNHDCGHCGRQLGFDPGTLDIVAEERPGSGLPLCSNRNGPSRCNWIADPGAAGLCLSCRMSQIIPSLSKLENEERWRKLETAKRRLLYDLLRLGLPVDPSRLAFRFQEDRRTNPFVDEEHIATGHRDGVISINAAEADDVFRARMRIAMNEPVRTLLGHFRHESGHYYFDEVVDDKNRAEARSLFGDETADYNQALASHYQNGPPSDWRERFISSYAASHPAEDWAECWAHYLHIRATLESAAEAGFVDGVHPGNWHAEFVGLVLDLNEIMRSLGLPDAYPFVLTRNVAGKIEFIHEAIERCSARNQQGAA